MKQILVLLLLTTSLFVHSQNPSRQLPDAIKSPEGGKQTAINYIYKVIPSINSTWGYDIFKDEKMLIHQVNKPGMPGNEGFKAKSDAKKVARLVIEKLKKGEMPPSVTLDEMKQLKVL
jgi:hypothetical protein